MTTDWIAERRLDQAKRPEVVTCRIGRPTRRKTGEWECAVEMIGIERPEVTVAYGEDSMQALLLALTMLRARVGSFTTSHGLTWLGGDDPGLGDGR